MVGPKVCLILYFISAAAVSGWVGSGVAPKPKYSYTKHLVQPIDEIIMASTNTDDSEAVESPAPGKVIDLQTHTIRKSPAETLASLSEACGRLGIEAFDVYGDFESDEKQSYLRQFEAEVAQHFGKEDGVFCLSGGMAQSIALLINAGKRSDTHGVESSREKTRAFACHPTSHLLLHENDHFSELLGMEAVVIGDTTKGNQNDYDPEVLKEIGCYDMEPIRLSHVQNLLSSLDGTTVSPSPYDLTYPNKKRINVTDTSTLILELPHREIGGKLTPWEEIKEMSNICKKRDMKFHCDGARIFEASAGYGHKSVKETAQPFTSIYISFYKGLGAISGAMLLGDSEFCAEARVWLRRMGGNLYSVLPYAISSWDGFRKYCLAEAAHADSENDRSQKCNLVYDNAVFENRRKKLACVLELLHADKRIASIVQFDPAVPQTNMVHGYLKISYDECMAALKRVEQSTGIRVLSRVRSCSETLGDKYDDDKFGCRFELTMGESNCLIEDELFVLGWSEIAKSIDGK